MSISTATLATMTIRELISALKVETDRAQISQLVYQIDAQVGTQRLQIQELLESSTKKLEGAYNIAKPADHMSAGGNISREALIRNANTADALGSHAYYYIQVALATAWWSHLDSIRQLVLNAMMADVPAERERLRVGILELYQAQVAVRFTTGEKFYATTEGGNETKRKRLLEHIQAEYGLENLCLFPGSEELLPVIVIDAVHMIWQRANPRITTITGPGGKVAITLSLS